MTIKHRNIWITGASSGIGESLLQKLAQHNHVIASARSTDTLNNLKKQHPSIEVLPVDIAEVNPEELNEKLSNFVDRLDLVILNAGMCEYIDHGDIDIDCFERTFNTNYLGTLRCAAAATPLLRKGINAQLGIVSSQSVLAPFPRAEAYGSSKAALEYTFNAMSYSLKSKNIQTCIIRPGFIDTPMTANNDFPMPFLMSNQEAAGAIIKGLTRRQDVIEFPKRLSWLLRLASAPPLNMFRFVAPKMARHNQL